MKQAISADSDYFEPPMYEPGLSDHLHGTSECFLCDEAACGHIYQCKFGLCGDCCEDGCK